MLYAWPTLRPFGVCCGRYLSISTAEEVPLLPRGEVDLAQEKVGALRSVELGRHNRAGEFQAVVYEESGLGHYTRARVFS